MQGNTADALEDKNINREHCRWGDIPVLSLKSVRQIIIAIKVP